MIYANKMCNYREQLSSTLGSQNVPKLASYWRTEIFRISKIMISSNLVGYLVIILFQRGILQSNDLSSITFCIQSVMAANISQIDVLPYKLSLRIIIVWLRLTFLDSVPFSLDCSVDSYCMIFAKLIEMLISKWYILHRLLGQFSQVVKCKWTKKNATHLRSLISKILQTISYLKTNTHS